MEKLNDLLVKSKPLKSWTSRQVGDVEVEIATRRTLAFLSGQIKFIQTTHFVNYAFNFLFTTGGDVVPLLNDILYPNEKELLGLAKSSISILLTNIVFVQDFVFVRTSGC